MAMHYPRRWTGVLVAVVLFGLVLAAVPSRVAVAGPADPEVCRWGSGHVCLYMHAYNQGCAAHYGYNDANYSNNSYDYNPYHPGWNCDWIGLNDSISSITNRGNHCDTFHYRHAKYRHFERRVPRGTAVSNLAWSDHNDELSSHRWKKLTGSGWENC